MVQPPKSAFGVERVAVGMSGGLDSSVVASLCVDEGWDVIGLTLHMFKEGSRCCSMEDVERARRVCEHLGIRHYVVNAVDQFEEAIIQPFIESYLHGRTPSPCILCNEFIKFGTLHRRARQLGCSHIATGHYVRLGRENGRWRLLRPRDLGKDQSYFLHRLSQEQLSRCLFPLESWTKVEAAAYAKERGLPAQSASKEESQDLCFVPDDGHARFVEARRPGARKEGEIVDGSGRVLGTHDGIHRFTVGQRRGLRVPAATRLYVRRLEADANRVVVGARDEAFGNECLVEDVHWVSGARPSGDFDCQARVRYRHDAADARVELLEGAQVRLRFREPQFAITDGQAAVMYDGDEILGGGWIATERFNV